MTKDKHPVLKKLDEIKQRIWYDPDDAHKALLFIFIDHYMDPANISPKMYEAGYIAISDTYDPNKTLIAMLSVIRKDIEGSGQ